jgi:hypothetical protein
MLGNIDWKWFLIGALFAMFVLPMLLGLVSGGRSRRTVTQRTA